MTGAVEKLKDPSGPTMKVDIVYFSRTGNTRRMVEILGRELAHHAQVRVIEIHPKRNYPYLIWLFLSFVPRLRVSMRCEESTAPVVFLCTPKWTFNCPPVTSFVQRGDLRGKTVALAITCGGFDERRYAADFLSTLGACGGNAIKDVLLVKRKRIDYEAERIKSWVRGVLAGVREGY
jgi:flavodoxin